MGLSNDKRRLVLEHAAMVERWGALNPCLRGDSGGTRLWWEINLRVPGNIAPIKIHYPDSYPAVPPELEICFDVPSGTPHLLSGRRACWRDPSEAKTRRDMWNPAEDTAALMVMVAYQWVLAYLAWRATNVWPVPDARA